MRDYLFLKNFFISEGAVSHNVLYYRQFSIARYRVLYANNYFQEVSMMPRCLFFRKSKPLDELLFILGSTAHHSLTIRSTVFAQLGCVIGMTYSLVITVMKNNFLIAAIKVEEITATFKWSVVNQGLYYYHLSTCCVSLFTGIQLCYSIRPSKKQLIDFFFKSMMRAFFYFKDGRQAF